MKRRGFLAALLGASVAPHVPEVKAARGFVAFDLATGPDMCFLASYELSVQEIARIFRVPVAALRPTLSGTYLFPAAPANCEASTVLQEQS